VGRAEELRTLLSAMRSGRQSIAAVMGGRGMGKTSLAVKLAEALSVDGSTAVHLIRRPASAPEDFWAQLMTELAAPADTRFPVEALVRAVRSCGTARTVLLIDEVEALIGTAGGRALLDNLRIAWEKLAGWLGIVVFGGSALRELLSSDTSPFLRTARWMPLRGLALAEAASLVRDPLGLAAPDDLILSLWEHTGGHPLLLQAILERAVELGPPYLSRLPRAMHEVAEERFFSTLFPIWWDNLKERGQAMMRALLARRMPVAAHERVAVLGAGPMPWIEVLETTGVARLEGGHLLPRGALFQAWLLRDHPMAEPLPPAPRGPAVEGFERRVLSAIGQWARATVEYPSWALRGKGTGNERLLPEQHFQLSLLTALCQNEELLVEAEGLSSGRGRADVKIRDASDPRRRACVEVKLWGGTGYREVVTQALGYVVPEDDFACVVMVDRLSRSLAQAYREQCLEGAQVEATGEAYPALASRHERPGQKPVRVWHFLVQLPGDGGVG
jgi:type II secretory pathway predicted ATPase ExeA